MPFGLSLAGDVFQQKLDEVFSNLQGVTGIADDKFIYGDSDQSHGRYLKKVRLDKIQYKKTSVEFYKSHFTTDGHKPIDMKIQDIQLMLQH